jgi:hypothetical protein
MLGMSRRTFRTMRKVLEEKTRLALTECADGNPREIESGSVNHTCSWGPATLGRPALVAPELTVLFSQGVQDLELFCYYFIRLLPFKESFLLLCTHHSSALCVCV